MIFQDWLSYSVWLPVVPSIFPQMACFILLHALSLIWSFVDGHVVWFRMLTVVCHAAVNIDVQVFLLFSGTPFSAWQNIIQLYIFGEDWDYFFLFCFLSLQLLLKKAPAEQTSLCMDLWVTGVRIPLVLGRLECSVLLEASYTEGSFSVTYRNA